MLMREDARDGFAAMGHPVPTERLDAALAAVREMVPDISTEDALGLIGRVADRLERDDPYKAQREARGVLDLTGTYRLIATLLSAPVAA